MEEPRSRAFSDWSVCGEDDLQLGEEAIFCQSSSLDESPPSTSSCTPPSGTPRSLAAWMQKKGTKFPHPWQDRFIEFDESRGRLRYSARDGSDLLLKAEVAVISARAAEPRPLLSFRVAPANQGSAVGRTPPRGAEALDRSVGTVASTHGEFRAHEIIVRPKDTTIAEMWLRRVVAALAARDAAVAAQPPPPPTYSERLEQTGRHLQGTRAALVAQGTGSPRAAFELASQEVQRLALAPLSEQSSGDGGFGHSVSMRPLPTPSKSDGDLDFARSESLRRHATQESSGPLASTAV